MYQHIYNEYTELGIILINYFFTQVIYQAITYFCCQIIVILITLLITVLSTVLITCLQVKLSGYLEK